MISRIFETSGVVLPAQSTLRREPPTPPELRRPNYLGLFDSQTVFCDVFESEGQVVLVGPPLLNLEPIVLSATVELDGQLVGGLQTQALNRAQRSWLADSGSADSLHLHYGEIEDTVLVRSDQNHLLENRRVLLGMQRNNPLRWLREWASVFQSANGVDALVIYDLMSTHYSQRELLEALADVPGIEVVIVVCWPYKYGAQPLDVDNDPWDSDFGQYVAWEHAYRRFLRRAYAVTVADVDELFLANDGRSIFEHAEDSPSGIVKFKQRDILPVVHSEPTAGTETSYADYCSYDPDSEHSTVKYAAIIPRLGERHQLLVHTVAHDYTKPTDDVLGRQFIPMKLAWLENSFERSHPDTVASEQGLSEDIPLRAAYARAGLRSSR